MSAIDDLRQAMAVAEDALALTPYADLAQLLKDVESLGEKIAATLAAKGDFNTKAAVAAADVGADADESVKYGQKP